jgi:hypothetical protein
VNCGPRSYFLYIAITYLLYLHCLLSRILLLLSTRYAHSFVSSILYFVNCPTVICLPSMLFYLWRDTSSELWTSVHSFIFILPSTASTVYFLQALFILPQTNIYFHTIRLILCLQQTGEIDKLTISWAK